MGMKTLYPSIKPYSDELLQVDSLHSIYIEQCGEPSGIPVLFVHGGPGAGCSQDDRRFFDPEVYRIILFDQRGCGRSKPHSDITNNTTQDLINDIEAIREHLNIDKWMLFGGSWGSTLSLLYAQSFPERVKGMVLRGIFLCTSQDLDWFYQNGTKNIFPDYWHEFESHIPEAERDNMIAAYHKRLTGKDELARMNAAKHWSEWEAKCATLNPCKKVEEKFTEPHTAMSLACIENHFFMNNCFIEENQILLNMDKIKDIPGIIVHGRYDVICPLKNARDLYNTWPASELHIIRDAGHASTEPSITDALVGANQTMAKFYE
jgi:proline iminopeptidase